MTAVLSVQDLHVTIGNGATTANVLRGVSLEVQPGEVRGLVGESGAGKSMLGRAVLGLLPANAHIVRGTIRFEGRDFLGMPERERRGLLGRRIALIPQDPMTSLNPVKRVGAQIAMVLRHHLALSRRQALRQRLHEWPHVLGVIEQRRRQRQDSAIAGQSADQQPDAGAPARTHRTGIQQRGQRHQREQQCDGDRAAGTA